MSTQIQDNKNIRKSSEELIKEAKEVEGKIIATYVPLICKAIQEENPEYDLKEIQDACVNRCHAGGLSWKLTYIQKYWGEFARSYQKTGKYSKAAAERKFSFERKISKAFEEIPTPKPVQEEYTIVAEEQEDDNEELDAELQGLGYAEFGETGKTLKELEGDFYESTSDLFRMLTQKDISDDSDQDFLVEYLRPTREFRKSLALELTERKRTIFYNRLHSIVELSEDFMHAIDEANKK